MSTRDDEEWTVGPLMPVQPFKRVDVSVPPGPPEPCPPLRLSDCPACGVDPGQRCVGIDHDDEVHIERVWKCGARWNGAS